VMSMVELSLWDIALASLLLLGLAGLLARERLGISVSLLVSGGRMVLQLLLVGYVLAYLFEANRPWLVAAMAIVMLGVASREIMARQRRKLAGWSAWRLGASALFVSSFTTALYGLALVVRSDPWYAPQYAIPILGMIISNTMNALSLGMERLTDAASRNRWVIEQRLALGESARQSIRPYAQDCIRSGMTPVINSMATAGIVSLPGMMTGQILAGASPAAAVKYQIVIWFLISCGSGFGLVAALRLMQGQLFDKRDRLRLDRLSD